MAVTKQPPKKPKIAPKPIPGSSTEFPHIPGAGLLSADDAKLTTITPSNTPAIVQQTIVPEIESNEWRAMPSILTART
jgi:hypothetical protein